MFSSSMKSLFSPDILTRSYADPLISHAGSHELSNTNCTSLEFETPPLGTFELVHCKSTGGLGRAYVNRQQRCRLSTLRFAQQYIELLLAAVPAGGGLFLFLQCVYML
jgi:hypothetical protein